MGQLVDDDFALDVQQGLAKHKKKIANARGVTARTGGPYPGYPFVPQVEHKEYILVVHHVRCKNCGSEESWSNAGALAHFVAPADGVTSYIDKYKINPELPKKLVHMYHEKSGPDFCQKCWQPTTQEPFIPKGGSSAFEATRPKNTWPTESNSH